MNFHIINFLIIFKSFSVSYETRRVDVVDALLLNIYFWFNRLHVKRWQREKRVKNVKNHGKSPLKCIIL